DPEVAAARNQQFREHPELEPSGEPGELLPPLGPGVLQRDATGAVVTPARTCVINPRLDDPFQTAHDELARAQGFVVLTRSDAPTWSFVWGERDEVGGGPLRLWVGDGDRVVFPEVDAWLDEHGAAAVTVRPDHYVWGIARDLDELPALVGQLARQLRPPAAAR